MYFNFKLSENKVAVIHLMGKERNVLCFVQKGGCLFLIAQRRKGAKFFLRLGFSFLSSLLL
jgi:hypothetical protein